LYHNEAVVITTISLVRIFTLCKGPYPSPPNVEGHMVRTIRFLGVLFMVAMIPATMLAARASGASPSVTIESPATGITVNSESIRVTVAVKNYSIECAGAGQPGKPGMGHIHAMLDGIDLSHLTAVECATRFTISGEGVKPGRHTLSVVLAADDHTHASTPASVTFFYKPSKAMPLPNSILSARPIVSIESPQNGAAVDRTFDMRLALRNFDPSCNLEGKAGVRGYGHLHVIVAQAGITDQERHDYRSRNSTMKPMIGLIGMPCMATVPVDLSAWRAGPAKITVVLVGDDHSPIDASPASVMVNIR
jgi:hypothetical protein